MDAQERQKELEVTSVIRGVDRYTTTMLHDRERGREFDTTVGQRMIGRVLTRLVPHVRRLQRDARRKLIGAQQSGRRLAGWEMAVAASHPERLGYIALRTILASADHRTARVHVCRRIGTVANLELRWEELREAEKARAKDDPPNRVERLKRTVKAINPRSLRTWLRKLDDLTTTEWDSETRLKVGLVLTEVVLEVCPDFITSDTVFMSNRGFKRKVTYLIMAPEAREAMDTAHRVVAECSPWLLPMVSTPRPWTWAGDRFDGGYLTISTSLFKRDDRPHTGAIASDETVPQVVLDALSAIGNTPWRINSAVLDCARVAFTRGLAEVLPVAPPMAVPEPVAPDVWAKMSPSERGEVRHARRHVYDHNHRLEAKRLAARRTLRVAAEFVTEPALYFPHNLDFRGRAYPLPQDLHPQGDDFAKGLLTFAEAKPLGASGLRWLTYRAAATYGEDKVSREEQMEWALAHLDDIAAVAQDPTGAGLAFWARAEEPWQFLAAALELEAAFRHPDGPEAFKSSLPVYVDGTCNGLQHLSAMGRDPEGAYATNLTSCGERQDIYQIVADKVRAAVEFDVSRAMAMQPNPHAPIEGPAVCWVGHVDRKVVKRGVMTVPYGLTKIGMRDQLISDRWTEGLDGDAMANANYLRDLMRDAIDDTVVAASAIMGWMQDNAEILAKNNKAVEWETPAGLRVRQAYRLSSRKRVRTVLGLTWIIRDDPSMGMNVRKQAHAIVPNIVHSFDAAHMMLTIAAAQRKGLHHFAVVHDSFGCHACDMDAFLGVVREEFVSIYQRDWFASLQAEFQAAAGEGTPLISPPAYGDFDVTEVLNAPFFFA